MDMNFGSDIGVQLKNPKIVKKEQAEQEAVQQQQAQQPELNVVQWATTQAAEAQQINPQQGDAKVAAKKDFEIKAPGFDDLVVLSTVDNSAKPTGLKKLASLARLGVNFGALEDAYRETYKKSKSHNLLLERFIANVKFSGLKMMFSLFGVSAEEQNQIQAEVREEALKEIDDKLTNEYAHTCAMLEIVG